MKKRVVVFVVAVCMTILVGCGKKELLTGDKFESWMLEEGFEVTQGRVTEDGEVEQWDALRGKQIVSLEIYEDTQAAVDRMEFSLKIHQNSKMFELIKKQENEDGIKFYAYTYLEVPYYLMVSQRENTILKVMVLKGEENVTKKILCGVGY